jgi:hypothetical protein
LASITAVPSQEDGDHPTQSSNRVLRRTLAGNSDQERPLSLKWDEAGTLPNTGSIGAITTVTYDESMAAPFVGSIAVFGGVIRENQLFVLTGLMRWKN